MICEAICNRPIDDSSIDGIVLNFRDISERERAASALRQARDVAEEASRAKSAFLANMSHELRTPLNGIIGYSEMLQEDAVAAGRDETAEDLGRIRSAGRQLLQLINEILDLSKIEAGRMEVALETVQVEALVAEIVATVQPQALKNGNELHVDTGQSSAVITVDAMKVRQCVLNLLGNACKFTKNGHVYLTVSWKRLDQQAIVDFAVRDTGIGIKPDVVERLFGEFMQADASTARAFGGTGLGLAISQRLARLMGGGISVTSEIGVGSTFTLSIPTEIVLHDEGAAGELPVTPGETPESRASRSVLVIDDDPTAVDIVRRVLARDGLAVAVAHTGGEGLALAREHKPLAVLLDVQLPDMSGWKVLSSFKGDPRLWSVPVAIYSVLDDQTRARHLNADDYFGKPLESDRLLAFVRKLQAAALAVERDHVRPDGVVS